jgi:hypothetical protein
LILPKGNSLIERISLPFPDVNVMLNNLEQQGFTGYVKMEIDKYDGYIFFDHGNIIRALELEGNSLKIQPLARILNKMKKSSISTSSYVLSSQLVTVLSLNFAFQPLYLDYEIREKELKKVMSTLETDLYTGVIEVITRDGTSYMLVDKGSLVTDFFSPEYGQIIAGHEYVHKFLDFVSNDGAIINIFAEKQEEIDSKRRTIEEELEKIKPLVIKEEKGLFKAPDIFWIDEYILQEWGIKGAKTIQLELETSEGIVLLVKAQPGKKLGGYLSTVGKNIQKLKLKEGDPVSVKPAKE